jgi:signal transduction histidine kinase
LLSVRDSGPGMPRDLAEAISRPGGRVANREHRGPGLGLQIVRGIVEAHGGRIWVETTEGQGSTFRVTLPVVNIGPSNEYRPIQR